MKALSAFVVMVAALVPCLSLAQATGVDRTKGLYFDQKLGVQIPLDLKFKDDAGKDVRIGDYFHDKPVILALVFYQCQSSCLLIREGLLKTLNAQKKLKAGQDFEVVVVSINHKEGPEQAAAKKADYLKDYRYPETGDAWHLLTGSRESILSLTKAVGFGFTFKEEKNEETGEMSDVITHPSGIILLTPDGVTSLYLLGATYPAELLFKGLNDAKTEKIGPKTETILLGCYMYDAKTGKYRPVVENILKVAGIGTMLVLFGSIAVMSFRHRRTPLEKSKPSGGAA